MDKGGTSGGRERERERVERVTRVGRSSRFSSAGARRHTFAMATGDVEMESAAPTGSGSNAESHTRVTDLPLDVQQSILGSLDWQSLPKAAMACSSWSELVRRHESSPGCGLEWSHAMFRGSPAKSPLLRGGPKSVPGAERDFVRGLLDRSGYLDKSTRPDLVVVTVTPSWEPKLQLIADAFLELLPNRRSVHVVCCVAVGIIGTDESGVVHEIDDGSTEADAIAVALLHLGQNQRVFSVAERNSSARQRRKKHVDSSDEEIDRTLSKMEAFMKGSVPEAESGDPAQRCRAERGILGLLVGDNVYDVSDMKTKIEGRFGCIHLMGGLCGYDTRKQAVYYSSPESRKLEEEARAAARRDAAEGPQTRSAAAEGGRPWKRPRISACALFVCNLRSTRASYRGIKQLMPDYRVEVAEADPDGSKVCSLRQVAGDGRVEEGPPVPIYQVLRELEEVHGSLHGVTFGVKRRSLVSIDSQDPVATADDGTDLAGHLPATHVRTQVESVDIVRGVWDSTSPGTSRLEAIVVPLDLGPQDVCSFYTYSAQESLRELGEILDTLGTQEQRIEGSGCFGGFLVICNARGTYLHNGKQNVESNVLTSALPNTPVIGFFANGEVGPMPFREYFAAPRGGEGGESGEAQHVNTVLQGNTSVLTLLRRP